jgi:hypothetical protein
MAVVASRPRRTVRALGGFTEPMGGSDPKLGGTKGFLGSRNPDVSVDTVLDFKAVNVAMAPALLGGRELFAPGFGGTPGVDFGAGDVNIPGAGDSAGPGAGPGPDAGGPGVGEGPGPGVGDTSGDAGSGF